MVKERLSTDRAARRLAKWRAAGRIGRRSRRPGVRAFLLTVICIAAVLTPIAGADTQSGDQEVIAQVGHAIELTVPPAYNWGTLVIGENESSLQDITVKSTAPYDLSIRGDRVRLAEYHLAGGNYVAGGRELQSPLLWMEVSAGAYLPIGLTDSQIVVAAPPTGSTGSTTSIRFRQMVGYGDQALPDGIVYRIVLTYTAMNTI